MNKNLFSLEFVHLEDLLFHEICDFKRTQKLAEEIKKDGHLKNPVLVGSIKTEGSFVGRSVDSNEIATEGSYPTFCSVSSGCPHSDPSLVQDKGVKQQQAYQGRVEKLLVLDGVNRISALRLLNIPDVLIQRVDYEDEKVKLSSWNHLIFNAQKEEIIKKLKDLNLEVSFCPLNWAEEALKDQRTISYFLFSDLSGFVVNTANSTSEDKVKNLCKLMATYNGRSEIRYLDPDNHFISMFEHFENSSAVNLIPQFDKKEILNLALKGILLPFGVTRFIVPNRVLGLEVSCSVLAAQTSLLEKNLFLKELLIYRLKTQKAKFYQESVTLFNE
jgi:hypothetical protein